jgi:hypothetical protein
MRSHFSFGSNAGFEVGQRRGFFQVGKCPDDLDGHPVGVAGDFEIFDGALRLRAPVDMSRHLHFAHGVFFNAVFHYSMRD